MRRLRWRYRTTATAYTHPWPDVGGARFPVQARLTAPEGMFFGYGLSRAQARTNALEQLAQLQARTGSHREAA